MTLTQDEFNKLIAIAGIQNFLLKEKTNLYSVEVDIYDWEIGDVDRTEKLTLDDMENFIDSIFEKEVGD